MLMSNLDWCVSVTNERNSSSLLGGGNLIAQKTLLSFRGIGSFAWDWKNTVGK